MVQRRSGVVVEHYSHPVPGQNAFRKHYQVQVMFAKPLAKRVWTPSLFRYNCMVRSIYSRVAKLPQAPGMDANLTSARQSFGVSQRCSILALFVFVPLENFPRCLINIAVFFYVLLLDVISAHLGYIDVDLCDRFTVDDLIPHLPLSEFAGGSA